MLDVRFVAENAAAVRDALSNRSGVYDVDAVVALDVKRRGIIKEAETLKSAGNKLSADVGRLVKEKKTAEANKVKERVRVGKERVRELDGALAAVEEELRLAAASLPNIPDKSVPVGKSDADNAVVRRVGKPRTFEFTPQAHWDIGESLKMLDPASAAKITGARFTVYYDLLARLERAVTNFMLDTHTAKGYREVFPPFMVNRDSMFGTGQLPKFEEDAFAVKNTNYFLVPTAEVPVTNLHRGDIMPALPVYYCAYTACFRAEAGSAGRDTRGLIRQHQFNKVELVKFVRPENSFGELEKLTADAEDILKKLNLAYRVVCLCTGDLGFSSAKTYDIEVWMPSYGRYVEISSCSDFLDFQARRMNIRYRDGSGKTSFVHTLNGSGLAVGRTVAAIIENYQNADGSVTVPDALVKYMGVKAIR